MNESYVKDRNNTIVQDMLYSVKYEYFISRNGTNKVATRKPIITVLKRALLMMKNSLKIENTIAQGLPYCMNPLSTLSAEMT